MESDPPPGFKPLFRTSPFLDHNGPFFYREERRRHLRGRPAHPARARQRAAAAPMAVS